MEGFGRTPRSQREDSGWVRSDNRLFRVDLSAYPNRHLVVANVILFVASALMSSVSYHFCRAYSKGFVRFSKFA
jgi:hypothetical protein